MSIIVTQNDLYAYVSCSWTECDLRFATIEEADAFASDLRARIVPADISARAEVDVISLGDDAGKFAVSLAESDVDWIGVGRINVIIEEGEIVAHYADLDGGQSVITAWKEGLTPDEVRAALFDPALTAVELVLTGSAYSWQGVLPRMLRRAFLAGQKASA